ncbi:MAG: cyclic nucleotide-binding domain-containing protein, partial [Verrucomicrobiota bacterium]
ERGASRAARPDRRVGEGCVGRRVAFWVWVGIGGGMTLADLFKFDEDVVEVGEGEHLLRRGEGNDMMYVLLEGAAEVRSGDKVLEKLERGSVVGEMSLIEKEVCSADVVTVSGCRFAKVNEKQFQFLVHNHPLFPQEIMRIMAGRLREAGGS